MVTSEKIIPVTKFLLPPNLISATAVPYSHAITEGNCVRSLTRKPIDSLSPTHTQWQIETGKGCGIVAVIEREIASLSVRQKQ